MDLKEWCEYMRDVRDYFGLKNEDITKAADSSDGTTEKIMSGNPKQDVMRATARRYEQAIIGPVGEFSCYLDHNHELIDEMDELYAQIAALKESVQYWRNENDRKAKVIDKLLG
jgi:hypothetical protein